MASSMAPASHAQVCAAAAAAAAAAVDESAVDKHRQADAASSLVCMLTILCAAGKTLAENLADCPPLKQGQDLLRTLDNPIKSTGHIQILYGNLAPDGAVGEHHLQSCVDVVRGLFCA